jgi:hypothetical protein
MLFWGCDISIFVMTANQLHDLSSTYFVNKPLHVSGVFIVHHQGGFTVYVQQLVRCITPDDGQHMPRHVEVDGRNKLRINSASGKDGSSGSWRRLWGMDRTGS